jgi:hypothetical protein
MTAKEHNGLLSIFFFIQAGLQLLGAIFIIFMFAGFGTYFLSAARGGDKEVIGGVFVIVAIIAGILSIVFTVFHFIVGWKMHKIAPSGRIWGIVASCLCLPSIPVGTALGVYGLWFFLSDEGKELYSSRTDIK